MALSWLKASQRCMGLQDRQGGHASLPIVPAGASNTAAAGPVHKRRRCEEVPRNAAGQPIFPIVISPSCKVLALGSIVLDRPAFHSPSYIWPVGFQSLRAFASCKHPDQRIDYLCEILDGGAAPAFRLTPTDNSDAPITGGSQPAQSTSSRIAVDGSVSYVALTCTPNALRPYSLWFDPKEI